MHISHEAPSPDASAKVKSPLSEMQAVDTTHGQARAELAEFAGALGTVVPVSIDKLAVLLEHLIKQQTSSDSAMIRDQMVRDGWDCGGADADADAESINVIAERVTNYLATEKGIALFNFFVKIFARTSSKIFLDESSSHNESRSIHR